ncbi:hypothetical protein L210DRAFT_3645155 [Boletus edulis BED1]|uniref:Uncharacterized protein n=1 Tax=Boletus edulis BED1 TaxID=1328754 RepID=A0AAD4BW49_BOLED|nr:hypothetical protein L210DRAFT_3645155 [Boletus edulis BED1]
MLLQELWIGMEQENTIIFKLEDLIEKDQEPTCIIIQQIHVVLMKLWTTCWHKVSDCPQCITDPIEAALALMTLNQDGFFKEPKDMIKIISKLEYCMCLIILKEIRAQATDTEAWTSLKYKGSSIAFANLCDMFQNMENNLITIWKDKILHGLPLRVDYQDLVDDPSNTDISYSFLFDPKNICFQDHIHLVCTVIEGQGEFSRFLLQQKHDGKPIWNHAALSDWLQDYAALQKLLLLCAEMLSGAPARGTELTATIYCNTQTQPIHNLMVFGQHMTLHCQYSKTSAMMGHNKLIPHSLDAITSDILIQDLALARPFAQLAALNQKDIICTKHMRIKGASTISSYPIHTPLIYAQNQRTIK